jgi:hypothetical protein
VKNIRPSVLIKDDKDQEQDKTHYPIPDWYPLDAVFITAEEQEAF